MVIRCPVCNAGYEDRVPGKSRCECGAKFCVSADGCASTAKPPSEDAFCPPGSEKEVTCDGA